MNLGIKEAFAVGVPYFIAVGACYLFGYWGAFNINVLEFITFADVAKLAVYPLMVSLVFGLLGLLFVEVITPSYLPKDGSLFGSASGQRAGIPMWCWKNGRLIIALQILLIAYVAIYATEPRKWVIVAWLIIFSGIPLLADLEKFIELVPNPRIRLSALLLLLSLPSFSFAYGRQQAFLVKTGASEQFVDVARSKLLLVNAAKNPVAYLGFLGGVYVLREAKTGQIVFVKQSDDPLFLAPKP